MADDRPLEDPADAIRRLTADLADLQSTVLTRLVKRPTGDIEPTIRATAKPGTLLLQGQLESRTTYAALWAWAQQQSLVVAGLFTVGDGSTTFGMPDFRGRVPRGVAASGESVGSLVGADTRTLSTANLPPHDHNVNVTMEQAGNHGGHWPVGGLVAAGTFGLPNPDSITATGNHTHPMNITENTVGSGTGVDIRQASIAVNWAIWT